MGNQTASPTVFSGSSSELRVHKIAHWDCLRRMKIKCLCSGHMGRITNSGLCLVITKFKCLTSQENGFKCQKLDYYLMHILTNVNIEVIKFIGFIIHKINFGKIISHYNKSKGKVIWKIILHFINYIFIQNTALFIYHYLSLESLSEWFSTMKYKYTRNDYTISHKNHKILFLKGTVIKFKSKTCSAHLKTQL